MIKKLKLRLNHWYQTKVKKKKPLSARIFLKDNLTGVTRTRILIKKWAEIETLYLGLASWRHFCESHCLTSLPRYRIISSGWKFIQYDRS